MLLPGWGGDIRGSADYMGGFVLGAKYVDMGILLPAALAAAETKKFATKDIWFY